MEGAEAQKREVHRNNVMNKIVSAINDQKACSESLMKNSTLIGYEIIQEVGSKPTRLRGLALWLKPLFSSLG
ncbi:UNVERIFIED_CONTAM: hypothetical protein Sangu_0751700 [Sesamum angustifolium]|uniref:Uncharacterized protein n=1 Tax=Sesamum angustifolium TaxID=2727405 RepID=A0AAW2PSR6_9LAMI